MATMDRQLSVGEKDSILARAASVIPGGVNSSVRNCDPRSAVPVRAQGAYFYDIDGKRYTDYQGGFGPTILGHSHPKVTERVKATLEDLDTVAVGVSPLEVELAEKLVHHVPSVQKVLLCTSGSDATYHAIRLARAVTGRKRIIKFQGAYHGFHDSIAMNMHSPEGKLGQLDPLSIGSLPEVLEQTTICEFNDLDQVADSLKRLAGQTAAVIVEPVAHNMGVVMPRPGFLEGLRELTHKNGTLLIFDEIITGFRHSLGGYQKLCGVTPDLTTLGKSLANGYPVAAVGGRADLMDRFNTRAGGDVFFAGTYNGYPAGCAAALATIEILEAPGVYEHLFRLGERMCRGLKEIMARHQVKSVVAGFGSVFLTYFMDGPVENYRDLLRNDVDFFLDYRRRMAKKGVYKTPRNLFRSHISLSHTDEDISRTLEVCEDTIKEMLAK
jgi:glutamate-1-semialdehyde 2,1-aminomutase